MIRRGITRIVFAAMCVTSLVAARTAEAADLQPPSACRKAIDARVPRWELSPPPADLAAYLKQKNMPATNVVQADFDANGTKDTALLLITPGTGNRNDRQQLAVCLTQGIATRLQLIPKPYCGDGISVAPKGTRRMDYQTGKPVTYWTNGVTTYCFEKASGTYLYRDVDSD